MQSKSAESAEIFTSSRFFIFLYRILKGTALIFQITNKECLRSNITRISQSLSILVSCDPCCYLSSKKNGLIQLLKFQGFKFSYTSAFFKDFLTLPMISKLSPVEVSLFQQKNGPRTESLLFGVRLAKGKIVFFSAFWYWRY